MSYAYTEDQLIEQPAIGLFGSFGVVVGRDIRLIEVAAEKRIS